MAAPKRNRNKPTDPLFEKSRAKIQTTQLVKRLQNNALGTDDDQGNKVELSNGQIRSIQILLDKSLATLTSTELSSPDGQPVFAVNIHEKQE